MPAPFRHDERVRRSDPLNVPKLSAAFTSPDHKRQYVRTLFSTIADRYDFITVVMSFGRDRAWKRRLVREAAITRADRVVDLACGTGDIAFEAAGTETEFVPLASLEGHDAFLVDIEPFAAAIGRFLAA